MNNEVKNDDSKFIIESLQELKLERKKNKELEIIVAVQKQQLAELKPKVSYYDVVLQCTHLVTTDEIAHDYGWVPSKMNEYLCDKGVQFKIKLGNAGWLLHQKYVDEGYTSTTMCTKDYMAVYTHWTQKGRLFIYDLLKRDGVLPLIER